MTRDEAIKIMVNGVGGANGLGFSERSAKDWLHIFEALGMLKVEEPKTPEERFWGAMRNLGYSDKGSAWDDIRNAFDDAGVKIVDK